MGAAPLRFQIPGLLLTSHFAEQAAIFPGLVAETPGAAEFLQKRLISEFFGFQWQNLAEILHLFKKYNNLRKVAVRE